MSSLPKVKPVCKEEAYYFNIAHPITRVEIFGNGVVRVIRNSKLKGDYCNLSNGRKGRKIKMLSQKSLQSLIATVQASDIELKTMLTLTYPRIHPKDGGIVKCDLNRILTGLRKRGKFEYVWFLEFQKRGAPHIHVMTDHDAITPQMRIYVAETWVGNIVKSDWWLSRVQVDSVASKKCEKSYIMEEVRKVFNVNFHHKTWEYVWQKDGAKRYITAYASKPEQKEVPKTYQNVGRFWGCSRGVALGSGYNVDTTEQDFRKFLEGQEHLTSDWDILPKYLYNVKNIS